MRTDQRPSALWRPAFRGLAALVFTAAAAAGCSNSGLVLTQAVEVRRLSADLLVQLNKAVGAADRAVLADTDEASVAAASEARQARRAIEQDVISLQPLLQKLAYTDEIRLLDEFGNRFHNYQTLDDTVLGLAVENTNLKAQRLSFGPEREAGDAFRAALDVAVHDAAAGQALRAEATAARAQAAILEVQVLEGRHNAEADEGAMSAIEAQMNKAIEAARAGMKALATQTTPRARPSLETAATALGRFEAAHAQVVAFSRRNTNVQSAALELGRKRTLSAGCEELLNQLAEAVSKHEFKATR